MDLSQEELKDIFWDITPKGVTVVDGPDWSSDGKYDIGTVVFQIDDKHYGMVADRTGSYYTDYSYSWEYTPLEPYEVVAKETTTIEWVKK